MPFSTLSPYKLNYLGQNTVALLNVDSDADGSALMWSWAVACDCNVWLAWAEKQKYRLSRNSRQSFRGQISVSYSGSSSQVSFLPWVELDFCSTGNGKLC